jgi:GR25 family glycosyltransferase involved in LPS biosynthesis
MELLKNTLFINLENRTDRLEHVNIELSKLGIKGERVNAIKTSLGAIGCTLSHVKCLELAKQRNYEYVFICEDDITFLDPKTLLTNLTSFYEDEKINWDMLIVGGNNVPPYHKISDFCVRVFYCQTTTGYIVKNSYYDTLIKNFKDGINKLVKEPSNNDYKIDKYWFKLQIQHNWYMIIPPSIIQKEDYSDIEKKNTNFSKYFLDYNKAYK